MNKLMCGVAVVFTAFCAQAQDGFVSLFDGKTLEGWEGDERLWRVEDGCIVGETTAENNIKSNSFLIWRNGTVGDFELKVEYMMRNGNSGIQYRSFEVENAPFGIGGYQADIDEAGKWTGLNYGERYGGLLAKRGEKAIVDGPKHKAASAEQFADPAELIKKVDLKGWNEYHIIAKGNKLVQKINGQVMSELTDNSPLARSTGLLAFQLHTGPAMKIQFKNIRYKPMTLKSKVLFKSENPEKRVVFVAGPPSHGYGAHEHNAGSLLLARLLNQAMPNIETVVHKNGWPEDPQAFDGADAIVMYCDGGARHMVLPHIDQVNKLIANGVGLSAIHYGVEPTTELGNKEFIQWLGGCFETHWSVNPHWDANFAELPDHPAANGVKPFTIRDEWYFHMRFREGMQGVNPILSAKAPKETMSRPDGRHSGNPDVRKSVGAGEPQHVAWASDRKDGGRGFGFTGGHFHKNWAHDDFRKTVLNAIAWTAKVDVPEEGIHTSTPSEMDMEANIDPWMKRVRKKRPPVKKK